MDLALKYAPLFILFALAFMIPVILLGLAGRTEQLLLPPDAGLDAIPRVQVPAADMAAIARGQVIRLHVPLPPVDLVEGPCGRRRNRETRRNGDRHHGSHEPPFR